MPLQERMGEIGSRISRAIGRSKEVLHRQWNRAYFGFAEGRAPLERTHQLLKQEHLNKGELGELLDLLPEAGSGSSLQVDMAEKVHHTVVELFPRKSHRPFNPSDPAA